MTNETEAITSTKWADKSETICKLAEALCKAQALIESVKKDSSNPFFKSKYADLANVWAAIREPLTRNGLCVLQEPSRNGNMVIITTTLIHSSGEFVRSSLEMPVVKQDPQGYGSAITYARRYALGSIVGIAPEDDDGNAASNAKKPSREEQKQVFQAAPSQAKAGIIAETLTHPDIEAFKISFDKTPEFEGDPWEHVFTTKGVVEGKLANEFMENIHKLLVPAKWKALTAIDKKALKQIAMENQELLPLDLKPSLDLTDFHNAIEAS